MTRGHLSVDGEALEEGPAPSDRRSFMRRAALAAVGAGLAAPIVGAKPARADGSLPAYTDSPNRFTSNQQFAGRVGIGVDPAGRTPDYTYDQPLQVVRPTAGTAVRIDAHTKGLDIAHDVDHAGATYDLVNLFHKSSGDAVFITHTGGKPPGFTDETGGISALNVLIPYYLDDSATGRGGTIVNDRTGMRGLFIQSQAVVNDVISVHLRHFTNAPAIYVENQHPGYGQPVGSAGAMLLQDYSQENTITVSRRTAAAGARAMLSLESSVTDSGAGSPYNALQVVDPQSYSRFVVKTDGRTAIADANQITRAVIQPDGVASFGSSPAFGSSAVQLYSVMSGAGVQRNLALLNRSNTAGSGAQIEFDDSGNQYALITSTFDNVSNGSRSGSLRFSVKSSDRMTERLKLGGAGIGFFGATPVGKPAVTGSRSGTGALTSLLRALSDLGLVTDSTNG